MRKYFINLSIVIFLAAGFSSCTKTDSLDLTPLSQYSDVTVWKDPALIEPFINTVYANNLGSPFNYMRLACYTDEALNGLYGNAFNVNRSLITPDSYLEWENGFGSDHTQHFTWDRLYQNVRRENLFFEKIGEAKSDDPTWIPRLTGEAYFNRALSYHFLLSLYGGVPIVTHSFTLNEDAKSIARNSYAEGINYIVSQLDSAAALLPETYPGTQVGRATKGAALALKARVLLYAASDLHNPAKNSLVSGGYSNPELLGYTDGDAEGRWTAAKNAAKAVIDMNLYSLYKGSPAPGDSVAQNFTDYFISTGTEEDILLQYLSLIGYDDYPALRVAPNGYNGHGSTTPIGELVDDYQMADGTPFSWNDPAMAAKPYEGREPRFYASILYEGAQWRPRPADVVAIDPFGLISVGLVVNGSGQIMVGGLDNREGPINTSNGGYTGYYLRKAVDISFDPTFGNPLQNVPFRHIRYAEILLNYAEACAELGEDGEARTSVNMIRKRAGLPDLEGSLSGDALRQAIRHERRVELAFEDHRYFDVRRWLIGNETFTRTMHRADVKYVVGSPVTSYRKPDGSPWVQPNITNAENGVDVRVFNKEDYFFPIKRSEINKDPALVQNPGYN